nr:unnamed protein product [Trichobilharzia regenti]
MHLLREADEILAHGAKSTNDDLCKASLTNSEYCSSLRQSVDTVEPTSEYLDKDNLNTASVDEVEYCDEPDRNEMNDRNILPEAAVGLSLKAQNRYLQAKVRVLLEENQKLNSQIAQQDYDSVKRSLDQQAAEIKALTTRLNRATEECDRYKAELEKVRSSTRENVDSLRHNVDNLMTENKRLERQKTELIGAFKKQMKLIDVLRRQKMLIEASKCLQITEEEFLKALDW